ncbi:MAG: hypothetical protein WAX48_11960, partial [Desulfosalsimonadaceae bacterium]
SRRFPWRGQKLDLYIWIAGIGFADPVYCHDRFVDFYPLRQFAPVNHGNHQARGRIAMGKTPPSND